MNTIIKNVLNFVLARAKERTTWVGIVGMLSTLGLAIKPELAEIVASVGAGIASLILMLTSDKRA